MTNDEKRELLQKAAVDLLNATQRNALNKLLIKLNTRDAIGVVLNGTIAAGLADQLKNELVPLCEPFCEIAFFRLSALAGAVFLGDEGLEEVFGQRILAMNFSN